MNNSERVPLVRIIERIYVLKLGEEQNIEMEIMETGGRVAGLALEGGEMTQGTKN